MYTKPTLDYYWCNKYWGYLTKGMSEAELADFENARNTLESYEKLYSLVEYTSRLNETITTLHRRIYTLNPSMPQNMWRACGSNS